MPSILAFDPEEPFLGRIQADSIAPPHSPATIKLYISRVKGFPALANANLFADISCTTPLKEGHISILGTNCPGMSPEKPKAIVTIQTAAVQYSSIPDGKYVIKNRAIDFYWTWSYPIKKVHFLETTTEAAKDPKRSMSQVNKLSPIIQMFGG